MKIFLSVIFLFAIEQQGRIALEIESKGQT